MRSHAKAPSVESIGVVGRKARGLFGLVCLCVLGLAAFLGNGASSASAADFPGQGFLPDGRAWELASPPDKKGSDVMVDSARTRAAGDGSALAFPSLGGFGDVRGFGIATEYMAQRSTSADPGGSGWSTHAITPVQDPLSMPASFQAFDPLYEGAFSADLNHAVFRAWSPLTADASVENVENLYLRDDLRASGSGSYSLISPCLFCSATATPLAAQYPTGGQIPRFAGASSDFSKGIFESRYRLTEGAPANETVPKLYKWSPSGLEWIGLIPPAGASCGDGGPACVSALRSIAGQGAGSGGGLKYTSKTISDDGSRVIFTVGSSDESSAGNLYVRDDRGTESAADDITEMLNAVSGGSGAGSTTATYWAASAGTDGKGVRTPLRVFFTTSQTLTSNDPGAVDLYMWSEESHSERERLTVSAAQGSLTLTYGAQTTPSLPYDATASEVEAALNSLSSIGGAGGSVTVTGGPGGSAPYDIAFGGSLASTAMSPITADPSSLAAGLGSPISCVGTGGTSQSYQWLRNGVPINGATSATYTTSATSTTTPATTVGDAGALVQCQVKATNSKSASIQTSNPATQIAPAAGTPPAAPAIPAPTPSATITTPGTGGQTITCDSNEASWSGSPTFSYQWYRSGVALSGNGANTGVYTVQAADVTTAAVFQCAVTGTNAAGATTRFSANLATSPAPKAPAPPTAAATVAADLATVSTLAPGGHLTLVSEDREPADSHGAKGAIGASEDGHWVYFLDSGQLVAGGPAPLPTTGIYAWHDGVSKYVGRLAGSEGNNLPRQWGSASERVRSRVTPDGTHLLFQSNSGQGLLSAHGGIDYDQSGCGSGCTEFYVYDGLTDELACASCNRSQPATENADNTERSGTGAANTSPYINHPLSDDGRYVFFHTAESLIPAEDSNAVVDVYEYDTLTGEQHLISSGVGTENSYFLDASTSGRDLFFSTRERLSRWDTDSAIDIYDARVGGGFPEPPPAAVGCSGDSCQPAPRTLVDPSLASLGYEGPAQVRPKRAKKYGHKHKHRHGRKGRHRGGNTNHNRRSGR